MLLFDRHKLTAVKPERFALVKVFVACYLICWFFFLIYLYWNWNGFSLWQKIIFSTIELALTPDYSGVKFLFLSYSEFSKKLEEKSTEGK